ncbi:MAG: hypothetical protein NTV34_21375 [Proteobacteria bacterium]|nr:hypothetical protein [Pseudomonadota bacterium]
MRFCSVTPLILSIIVALLSCKAAQRDISALEGAKNDSEPQIARFDKALSELERSLVGATSLDNAATRFAEGSARIAAYRLQALGELYLKEGDWFKDFYEEFKLVEDTIGNYDKWVTILKKAPDTIDKPIRKDLEAKKALAFSKMKDLLSKNNWYGSKRLRGDTIRNELRTIKWESIKKDRKLVLEGVKERLRDLRDTKYQVDTLEKGNGLHELRRDQA